MEGSGHLDVMSPGYVARGVMRDDPILDVDTVAADTDPDSDSTTIPEV